ncbi:OmpA family protein [Paraburkholderia phenazinium]|uniref:OmpA family protein n=1 Tax=Paraburkholderia phenazinium TaxID=60549 RepID=A0A1G7TZK4_9BURK|nr:OmpA family protein [Paraburkholderia phenazinium]SDG40588.1 OmpA family protein [Paraburkholderia phenazinium]
MSDLRLGYPLRTIAIFAAALVVAVTFFVLPVSRGLAWTVATVVTLAAVLVFALRSHQIQRAQDQNAHVLAALGATTADLPVSLRTRMPLVLVIGDVLAQLFDRGDEERLAHVGDGAIWLRVNRPQDLPQLATAVKQWRDGRAPDGIVLSLAPALHAGEDALTQMLRVARQAVGDASRMLGARLPGYVAVYQRLTTGGSPRAAQEVALGHKANASASGKPVQWYGVSSATRLAGAQRFEDVMRVAEVEVQQAQGDPVPAARAAALASVIGWTQRVVFDVLTDRLQPATPWRLFGAGWIDCGPASGPDTPWARDVEAQTRIVPPSMAASPAPWPLPQPLIEALPPRLWVSPRMAALAHATALVACAGALAIWGAARNNQALLTHIGADLGRFAMIPVDHDNARRDALQALVADRDLLDRYGRTGVPLRLSFGMYRGAMLMPVLNDAIASYQPPPPPPAVVTLDSMSLFDSGNAQLKPGSTRAMVGALEMIKAHPGKRVLVAGYTDNVGNPDSNLKLSIARAGAVRDWLIEVSGISATQFAIQGYGDTRPIADNETTAGRAKNRRVEITLVPDTAKEVPLTDAHDSQQTRNGLSP